MLSGYVITKEVEFFKQYFTQFIVSAGQNLPLIQTTFIENPSLLYIVDIIPSRLFFSMKFGTKELRKEKIHIR
jgi:hypothetical protein